MIKIREQNNFLKSESIEDKILLFFMQTTPPISDAQFHEFAQSLGIDEHEAEEIVYSFLVSFLQGGKSKGVNNNYDDEQIKMGIEVEAEHVNNKIMQYKIVLDHLVENGKYYTYLKEMEAKMKESIKKLRNKLKEYKFNVEDFISFDELKKIILNSKPNIRDLLYKNIEQLDQEGNRTYGLSVVVEVNLNDGKLELNISKPSHQRRDEYIYFTLFEIACSYNYDTEDILGNMYDEYTIDISKLESLLQKAHIKITDINYDEDIRNKKVTINFYDNTDIFDIKKWFDYIVYPLDKFNYQDAINEINEDYINERIDDYNPKYLIKQAEELYANR